MQSNYQSAITTLTSQLGSISEWEQVIPNNQDGTVACPVREREKMLDIYCDRRENPPDFSVQLIIMSCRNYVLCGRRWIFHHFYFNNRMSGFFKQALLVNVYTDSYKVSEYFLLVWVTLVTADRITAPAVCAQPNPWYLWCCYLIEQKGLFFF